VQQLKVLTIIYTAIRGGNLALVSKLLDIFRLPKWGQMQWMFELGQANLFKRTFKAWEEHMALH